MNSRFALLFPGQGSQSVGMLADIAADYPIIQSTFQTASDVLGYDVWELAQNGPADKLNQTEFTQPALLAADIALWQCWQEKGGDTPTVVAGHSLGEYAALVCAGALAFEDALPLVANRGRYMQEAVPAGTGAMAAIIGLDDAGVQALCECCADGAVLSPANFNSVGQTVIAGDKAAVERAVAAAKDTGAKLAKLIPVSVPSHCALMKPAAERLARDLQSVTVNTPIIPVIHNVDVSEHSEPDVIKQALVDQLTQPVRWVETILKLVDDDIMEGVECGPGKVLVGLNKRIAKSFVTQSF